MILTGLAGVALGIAIMRLIQKPDATADMNIPDDALQPASKTNKIANVQNSDPVPLASAKGIAAYSRSQLALGSAGILVVLAVAIFAFRSGDGATANTVTPGSAVSAPSKTLDDVDTMIARLEARLKTDPTDGEGFRTLGWSYQNTGHPDKAIPAYQQASKLLPGRADILVGLGEAMVGVAKDVVTPEAKDQFDQAIKLDSKEPRARFFLSLYKAQHGEERAALDEWIALSNGAPAEQPWQADVQARIQKLATKLGVDIRGQLKAVATPVAASMPVKGSGGPDAATISAASALPAAAQANMIDGMVEGLANRLKANPDDVEGWIKLIRSRMVLKDKAKAIDDLAMARKAFAKSPEKLAQINNNVREFGL